MRTILTHPEIHSDRAPRNVSNATVGGRVFAARIAKATTYTDPEQWLTGADVALVEDVADLTGIDAELWEQRTGEPRENYLDRMATAILSTNPERDDTEPGNELAVLVGEAEAVVLAVLVAEAEAEVNAEAARYRLLEEAGRIEREEGDRAARAEVARQRRASGVSERLTRAAAVKAAAEEIDRTDGQPDDPSWSAAELRGVQKHSPFRNGSMYRFRRTDGSFAPVVA